MASRTLAGSLGLKGDWTLGEDNWKDENDTNLLKLSVLVQGRAISKVAATPGAPAEGDVYIFDETHATQANKIAVYDEGAWVYLTPLVGWRVYNAARKLTEQFNGTRWNSATFPAPITTDVDNYALTADDSGRYIRLTNAGTKTVTIATDAATPLPENGEWNIRNVGAGDATITPAGGVTVNLPSGGTLVIPQGGTVALKRVAADEFDLMGLVTAA